MSRFVWLTTGPASFAQVRLNVPITSHLPGVPWKRLRGSLWRNSFEITQLYVLAFEAKANGYNGPFGPLNWLN